MKNFVFVDMDGTLSNDNHRHQHMLDGDWDAYHEASYLDPVVEGTMELLEALHWDVMNICILTSRPEKYMGTTRDWLSSKAALLPVHSILMRPEGDWSASGASKTSCLINFFGDIEKARLQTAFILDDRDTVVDYLRGEGFTVFQAHRTIKEFVEGDTKR